MKLTPHQILNTLLDEYEQKRLATQHGLHAIGHCAGAIEAILEALERIRIANRKHRRHIAATRAKGSPCSRCEGRGVVTVDRADGSRVDTQCPACRGTGRTHRRPPKNLEAQLKRHCRSCKAVPGAQCTTHYGKRLKKRPHLSR